MERIGRAQSHVAAVEQEALGVAMDAAIEIDVAVWSGVESGDETAADDARLLR